jgi:hypothetical protein
MQSLSSLCLINDSGEEADNFHECLHDREDAVDDDEVA